MMNGLHETNLGAYVLISLQPSAGKTPRKAWTVSVFDDQHLHDVIDHDGYHPDEKMPGNNVIQEDLCSAGKTSESSREQAAVGQAPCDSKRKVG